MVSSAEARQALGATRAYEVTVDIATCDGCGICIFYCKPVVFEQSRALSRRGFYPAVAVRSEECNNCGLCELACPQLAICVRPT